MQVVSSVAAEEMSSLVGVLPLPVFVRLFELYSCRALRVSSRDAFVFARSCTSDQLCREQKKRQHNLLHPRLHGIGIQAVGVRLRALTSKMV